MIHSKHPASLAVGIGAVHKRRHQSGGSESLPKIDVYRQGGESKLDVIFRGGLSNIDV